MGEKGSSKERTCPELCLKDSFIGTTVEAEAEGISGRRHNPHFQTLSILGNIKILLRSILSTSFTKVEVVGGKVGQA